MMAQGLETEGYQKRYVDARQRQDRNTAEHPQGRVGPPKTHNVWQRAWERPVVTLGREPSPQGRDVEHSQGRLHRVKRPPKSNAKAT